MAVTIDPLTGLPSSNTPSPTTSASTLGSTSPLRIEQPAQDTTDFTGIIGSTVASLPQLNQDVEQQEQKTNKSGDFLQQLLQGQSEIPQQQFTMEQEAGINEKEKRVQNYTNQLNAIQTRMSLAPIQTAEQNAQAGRVTTTGVAQGQTETILRQNAIEALTTSALLQSEQGNLALAQNQINKAVDLKYKAYENAINLERLNYERNKEQLRRMDSKRAAALDLAIKKDEQEMADRKAKEAKVSELIVNANAQGAPQDIISRANKAMQEGKSPLEVANILGQYAGDYWGTQMKIAQYNKINADIQKAIDEGKATTSGKVSPEDQAKYLIDTVTQATTLASNSGRSGLRRSAEAFLVGSTDYTALETKVRTLKTNLLTLATDPNIKKFFGPQMSNNDVNQMLAAASTLDTEKQSPQELKDELVRVETIFQKFAPGYTSEYVSSGDEKVDSWYKNTSKGVTASMPFNGGYTDNQK